MGQYHNTMFLYSTAPQPCEREPPPEDDRVGDLPPATSMDSKYVQLEMYSVAVSIISVYILCRKLNVRTVTVVRGSKGYGFAMRGVRG